MSDEEGTLNIPRLSPLMGDAEPQTLWSPEVSSSLSPVKNSAEKRPRPLEIFEDVPTNPTLSPLMSEQERHKLFFPTTSPHIFQDSSENGRTQHVGDVKENQLSPRLFVGSSNSGEQEEKDITPRESLRNRLRRMNASKKRGSGNLSRNNSPEKPKSKKPDPEMITLDEESELDSPPLRGSNRIRRPGGLRARSRRRLRRSMSESNLSLRLQLKPFAKPLPEKRLNSKLFGKIAQLKSRIKEIETRREEETDVLNKHIESLTRARGEHKNTIDLLMKEVSMGEDEENEILGSPDNSVGGVTPVLKAEGDIFTIGSGRSAGTDFTVQRDDELVTEDTGQNHLELEMKKLQVKLDSANSQVDQLSMKLTHHRKESQMLYNQIKPSEESKVNLEHMQSKITELQKKNNTLEKSIQGEVMLMSAIETLRRQVEETRDTNKVLQLTLDEQASSHTDVIKNMKEKLNEKVELQQRMKLLEDQLMHYNKQNTWSETQLDTRTSTLNVEPSPNKVRQMSRDLNEAGLEMLGSITPYAQATNVVVPDSLKNLRNQNEENETLIKKLSANLAKEAAVDEVDERNAQIISSDFKSVLANKLSDRKTEFSRSNSAPIHSNEKKRRKSQDTDAAVLAVLTRIEVLARIEDLMTVEINRIREEMRAKTETLENKNKEVTELQRKLAVAECDKNGKVSHLEELIRQREISISELREKSDREIQNLQIELSGKDDTFSQERKQLEDELTTLRAKSSNLEKQLGKLESDFLQVTSLKKKVAQLEKELVISREEASAAAVSKLEVVQLLAEEMERLKNNYGGYVTLRKNVLPASLPRSKKGICLNDDGAGIAHYIARV